MFDAINTAGTGLSTYRTWLDVLANNIANVNDVRSTAGRAFQAQFVEAAPIGDGPSGVGQGVQIVGSQYSSPQGLLEYDPKNPLADAKGYVRRPDIDMSQQMGDLIIAQRGFQANATAVERATDVYRSAIDIGKGI